MDFAILLRIHETDMSDHKINFVNSIHFETSLHEHLDWDDELLESTLEKLSEYFQVCSKSDLEIVKVELSYIFDNDIAELVHTYLCTFVNGEENETNDILTTQKEKPD